MSRHVVVLAGGLSHERDVSLRSGSRLYESLRHLGMEVTLRDVDSDLIPWLVETKPDAAIIALHGGRGENGAIQGILEMVGIPYLGTPTKNCRLAWEKNIAKNLVERSGFTTPPWMSLSHNTFRDLGAGALIDSLVGYLGLPLMVKPQHGGSALGASVVRSAAELPPALVGAFAYGDLVVVEVFVEGVELAITVIEEADGARALPAVEIAPSSGIFDYESRYTAGLTTYFTPARLSDEVAAAAADLAIGAHRVLGLRDVSRTDAIVAPDGTVHFLEVNVSPGLTETSMLPMSVDAAGRDLGELY
ncbi:MAG TPA: D-alanine--D-alanine ligase, partial [Nakamurella sp.]|nr:D-alanine--D-alanine ligase [Nakamurella sp.]